MTLDLCLDGRCLRFPGRRSLGFAIAVLLHVALLAGAVVAEWWKVEELRPPRVSIRFDRTPPPAPSRLLDKPQGSSRGGPPGGRVRPRRKLQAAVVAAASPAADKPIPEADDPGEGDGDTPAIGAADGPCVGPDCGGVGRGTGDCQGDACGGGPAMLGPDIGARRCLDCPKPHLPPAYLRLGGRLSLLARICVNAAGAVDKIEILQGASAGVDAEVTRTLQGWRYAPHTVNRRPVPFCHAVRFVFVAD